jgi:hypothetical protein
MQTVVIIFLLSAGALCVVGQIASTFLNARAADEKKSAGSRSARSRASSSKSTAKTSPAAKSSASTTAAAGADNDEADSSLMRRIGSIVAAADAAGARLGVLGLWFMLAAVALVVDINVAFSIST